MTTHVCPNCNNTFELQFCNRCGQKTVHRITMAHLWHDLIHAFTHADKGFFHLFVALFRNPGKVAREYISEGKRKRYFMPFQYLIIVGAIATFIMVNTNFMEQSTKMINSFTGQDSKYTPQQAAFMAKVTVLQSKYYNILIMLQLPFYALATFWVYKRKKFNFAEILTLQTFVSAQTTILGLALLLFVTFTKSNPGISFFLLFFTHVTYLTLTYMHFFGEKTFAGFGKAILSYLLALILFLVFSILLGIVLGYIMMMLKAGR